jgi:cytochrome c oxidase cbb3-type subunit III
MTGRIVRRCLSLVLCALLLVLTGCEREARPFRDTPVPELTRRGEQAPFQESAWAVSEGKRLFENFNCVGCHSHGGGGMGPPLMDAAWIYGSRPANVFETIVEGRPNGMPSFRDRLTAQQVWQLVGYVRSMSGQLPIDVLPGRSDHMRYSTPENARRAETPVQTVAP